MPKGQKREKDDQEGQAQAQASPQEQNEPDAGDQPQAQGAQQGQDPDGVAWTRGDDPEDAHEQLMMANRGSTGGELNQPIPQRTPQQGDESAQDPEAYQSGEDVESQK